MDGETTSARDHVQTATNQIRIWNEASNPGELLKKLDKNAGIQRIDELLNVGRKILQSVKTELLLLISAGVQESPIPRRIELAGIFRDHPLNNAVIEKTI